MSNACQTTYPEFPTVVSLRLSLSLCLLLVHRQSHTTHSPSPSLLPLLPYRTSSTAIRDPGRRLGDTSSAIGSWRTQTNGTITLVCSLARRGFAERGLLGRTTIADRHDSFHLYAGTRRRASSLPSTRRRLVHCLLSTLSCLLELYRGLNWVSTLIIARNESRPSPSSFSLQSHLALQRAYTSTKTRLSTSTTHRRKRVASHCIDLRSLLGSPAPSLVDLLACLLARSFTRCSLVQHLYPLLIRRSYLPSPSCPSCLSYYRISLIPPTVPSAVVTVFFGIAIDRRPTRLAPLSWLPKPT